MVGKFLCMDENSEKLERLEYAKCMVEVNPNHVLPDEFAVLLPDESEHVVTVEYLWKPAICSNCKVFGHVVDNYNLAPSVQVKAAHKITPEDPTKLSRNSVRLQDRRRERYNVYKRKQAWKRTYTSNQEVKLVKSVEKDAVTDELVDSEDDMFNYTIPPIDLLDANIAPINVTSGIQIEKEITGNEQLSEKGTEKQNCINDMRAGTELEEGEISQQEEEASVGFVWQISENNRGKSDNSQAVDGNDGARHAESSIALYTCDQVVICATVNTHGKEVEENTSNKTSAAEHQIEIAEVNEVLNIAFPSNREVKEQPVIQIQQKDALDNQSKEKETESEALIRLIKGIMQEIEGKLNAEHEKREVNTKQFYSTKKTVRDFEDFKMRNTLNQMDKARLDGVAELVKQMLVSVSTNKSKNPYAHLTAPPAYKERPPYIDTKSAPAISNEKPGSKTPITRSRKKEMLRNLQENG